MINRPCLLLVIAACGALSIARGADTPPSSPSIPSSTNASEPFPSLSSSETRRPSTYRVEKGDTLGSVAHQFHCSVASLKKLNHLRHSHLKPGLVLDLPASHDEVAETHNTKSHHTKSAQLASEKASKSSRHHHSLVAQPVQDFDVSTSTFASCPVPAGSDDSDESVPATIISHDTQITSATPTGPTSTPADFPPPLVAQEQHASLLPVPELPPAATTSAEASSPSRTFSAHRNGTPMVAAVPPVPPILATAAPARSGFASAIANFFGGGSHPSESGEWGNRFLTEARDLAGHGIGYDGSWRPDGEAHAMEMDCSNTSRYLYRVTAGIQLPRTASDQYYYLHLQDKAWDVPMTERGFADCNYLRSNLKPGDLLFWENTYRPERQPPITHVMIYLGTDSRGHWLMAGSQSGRHGLYNPHHSGPDVYVFNPTQYSGGYTTWLGLVHHHGRFVAYGRPLEADAKKLSVAAND